MKFMATDFDLYLNLISRRVSALKFKISLLAVQLPVTGFHLSMPYHISTWDIHSPLINTNPVFSDSDNDYFYDVETFSTEGETTPGRVKSDDESEVIKTGATCLDPHDVIMDEELEELDNVSEGISQHKSVLMHMASQVVTSLIQFYAHVRVS